jgi:NAD(P)-dependent dehydrogenase (short-subunit alcohol dehydrogenase family)
LEITLSGRLDGKVAAITGSTSGIGEGIARGLAAEGAAVVISGRRESEGEAVAEAIRQGGGRAVFQRTDIASAGDCQALCQRAVDEFGGLDLLVNNAGVFPRANLDEVTVDFWDRIFAVNVRGAFLCCQAAVPHFKARGGGVIINVGSGNAFGTGERLIVYGASKAALYNLTMNLGRCLARDRIRVHWITVGWVMTEKEFEVQEGEGRSREQMLEQAGRLPMGEYTTVEDIAAGCVYLAGDDAVRVSGADLVIGAGIAIHM